MNCEKCKYFVNRICINNDFNCAWFEPNEKYESKENKMKPQFESKKEFEMLITGYGLRDIQIDSIVNDVYEKGYIRKSDLEILIEEAEEMWNDWQHNASSKFSDINVAQGIYKAFQAMKAELNKRRSE